MRLRVCHCKGQPHTATRHSVTRPVNHRSSREHGEAHRAVAKFPSNRAYARRVCLFVCLTAVRSQRSSLRCRSSGCCGCLTHRTTTESGSAKVSTAAITAKPTGAVRTSLTQSHSPPVDCHRNQSPARGFAFCVGASDHAKKKPRSRGRWFGASGGKSDSPASTARPLDHFGEGLAVPKHPRGADS